MPLRLLSIVLLGLVAAVPATKAAEAAAAVVDIPYEEFTLDNGLRVIVHTDRKAPVIAVNLWYHVGSKDEPAGRTGFAHLFEHLMFQASEHHPGEYFDAMEEIGATDQNGTTNRDRTNYFETVPATALDVALFMESDRMGHLLGAIDQAALDAQREVVKNEKRQKENEPYGQGFDTLLKAIYPPGHPYHHTTIGAMRDIDQASLADVKAWFGTWYGPNNATLVLAGDIDLPTAKAKVAQYFGDIAPSATLARPAPMVARRDISSREIRTDRVANTRVIRSWNIPPFGDPDVEALQVLAQVLGASNSSRLDRRLVFAEPLVDSVRAELWVGQLGGSFMITADVRQGVDPARVEQALAAEMATLLANGPTPGELAQAKGVLRGNFMRSLEKVGEQSGKADVLNECVSFTGDPGCFRGQLARLDAARVDDVRDIGRRWLARGDHTLLLVDGERAALAEDAAPIAPAMASPPPDPRFRAVASGVDRRSGPPVITQFPPLVFPAVQRATLANGMTVLLAERRGVPTLELRMDFPAGMSSDAGGKLGTADLSMRLLGEAAGHYDALALRSRIEELGAVLSTSTSYDASLDLSGVSLTALADKLDASLALYADVIRRPRFEAADIERLRAISLGRIRQDKTKPPYLALRLLLPALYGPGHPYSMPFNGFGTEASVTALTREDLVSWHRRHFRPDAATLLVVGDTSLAEILAALETHFGDWRQAGTAPPPAAIASAPLPDRVRVFLVDVPGAIQSSIAAGQRIEPGAHPQSPAFDIANSILGGAYDEGPSRVFNSRLNMNLREEKHWTYGAYTFIIDVRGQRPWVAAASVQTDKTAESIVEMQREIGDMTSGRRPVSAADVARIQTTKVRVLPGAFETNRAVLEAIGDNRRFGRPDDDVGRRKARIEALTPDAVQAAVTVIDPKALTWVVVGDLAKIEAGVRALNLGEVAVVDADGRPVAREQ
jgi:zinc protease